MANSQSSSVSLAPILWVNFIGTLGYSIVLPFLIIIVIEFGGNELIYGIMGATYSFFQLIGAPILGNWSDKVGRRKILLLSQGGTFLAWIIFIFALLAPKTHLFSSDSGLLGTFIITLPLLLLFAARAFDGLTGGNISVANAYLADISDDKNRKVNFGKMSSAANLGFIIGPAIAGILGATAFGNLLPVIAALIISFLAIIVIFYKLKDPEVCPEQELIIDGNNAVKVISPENKPCYKVKGASDTSFRQLLNTPNVITILIIYFLVFLGFNFFYVAFPVHAIEDLHWSSLEMGIFFSIMSGTMILFQGPVLKSLSKKFDDQPLIIFGSLLLTLGFAAFTQNNIIAIAFGTLLFSSGNGIMWPSFLSKMSTLTNKETQGALQGIAGSVGSFASILGLILGGLLFGQLHVSIFWIPATIFAIIFIGYILTQSKQSK